MQVYWMYSYSTRKKRTSASDAGENIQSEVEKNPVEIKHLQSELFCHINNFPASFKTIYN